MDYSKGPIIFKDEVRKYINSFWPGKTPGDDAISPEILQALDEIGLDKITEIYDTSHMQVV